MDKKKLKELIDKTYPKDIHCYPREAFCEQMADYIESKKWDMDAEENKKWEIKEE